MTPYQEKLSAFLDGELSADEALKIEKALETDAMLQAELESLMAADELAKQEFQAIADEPIPLSLAQAVQEYTATIVANDSRPPAKASGAWLAVVAASIALLIGGVGGFITGQQQIERVAAAPGWLTAIANYHAVYATQKRHLVEVPASDAEHIRTWLSATVGAQVRIPDLSAHGLEFQGARLLVAAGKPVSQLMYLDADQQVVALCLIKSDTPQDGFTTRTIGAFDMVTWGGQGANLVIVGDKGRADLDQIARTAATEA